MYDAPNHAAPITPSDDVDCPATTWISFSQSGSQTLRITTVGGDELTITGLAGGVLHPIRAKRVWSTGTTVTTIVGWWT
jgi:hypothetical protein